MNPVECRSHGPGHLWLLLRCGGCEGVSEAVVTHALADRFGDDLERGMARIEAELERLERELMAHEAEVFEAALEHDLIGPDDFL